VLLSTIVHRIDPVIAQIGGVALWWYGLSYTLGFLQIHLFLMRRRAALALSASEVTSLSLWLSVGVLAGGRVVEVAFDEWPFYRQHLSLIPAYWLGGMATHGLLAGAAVGSACFARLHRKPFLELADTLVIPGALLMGLGRIGNFIDGQIVGSVTYLPWGVLFPDAELPRHPVVLYDAAKNLLLVPYLLHVQRRNPTPGAVAARFVFWYAFPRIFIDLVRDYPTHRLALGTGQTLNLVMAALGAVLLVRSRLRRLGRLGPRAEPVRVNTAGAQQRPASPAQQLTLAAVLAFCLVIPSNWTQDVPLRYGKRHPGLHHSWLYPRLATAPTVSPLLEVSPVKATVHVAPLPRHPAS
jgi:phosphatidylglycerol---prolipoprotein diacylglyceryl transferase